VALCWAAATPSADPAINAAARAALPYNFTLFISDSPHDRVTPALTS
jgi:hypothetical protein